MTDRLIHLRGAGASLVLDATGEGLPRVVHWGADLGDGVDLAALALATTPPIARATLDVRVPLSLLPERAAGHRGRPGLTGSRGGRAWSPSFPFLELEQPDADGAVVAAEDPGAGLALRSELRLAPSGLLAPRHTLRNEGDTPYRLDELACVLPVPAVAREVLDLTGRWRRERSPQRRELGHGTWLRESRHGRTGHDATLMLVAGTPGFGFRTGEVWGVHLGWSGDASTWVERLPDGGPCSGPPSSSVRARSSWSPDRSTRPLAVRRLVAARPGRPQRRHPRLAPRPAATRRAEHLGGGLLRPPTRSPGGAGRHGGAPRRGAVRAGRRLVRRPARRHRGPGRLARIGGRLARRARAARGARSRPGDGVRPLGRAGDGEPRLRRVPRPPRLGVHTAACYCDASAEDFRAWLRERYGDVEALNRVWGTDFWSQRYGSFEEVEPPRRAPSWRNPGQILDWRRFCSDALRRCYRAERDVLRRATPEVPVTTNFYGLRDALDLWAWADEDVVANDAYPDPADPAAAVTAAFGADLMRSLRHGQPWLLMEQAVSAVNWRPRDPPKPPGVMRLWSLQALARGVGGLMFFQWRASVRGAERFHSAMLPHGGRETRTFREVRALGAELPGLERLAGKPVHAEAALLLDWDAWWALESGPRPSTEPRVPELLLAHYAALHELNVTVDVRPSGADLSAYRLVVAPTLFSVSDEAAAALARYVEGGGHLLLSFFSGIVDEGGAVRTGGHPGAFRELLGLAVDDFWPLAPGEHVELTWAEGAAAGTGSAWSEWVEPRGSEVLMKFAEDELAGRPAATRNGRASYLATLPDPAAMRSLVSGACAAAGVRPALEGAPAGVEAVRRGDALVLLNHRTEAAEVEVGATRVALHGRDFRVLDG